MKNYIEVTKTQKVIYELSEPLTEEQLKILREEDLYNLPDGVIDFSKEEIEEEDHHLTTVYHNDRVIARHQSPRNVLIEVK